MSIKAGRVGVNPSQVDPVDGSILSSAISGYTKQEADAKFLSQTDAASTYESKSDASTAHNALQPKTLAVPIEMLSGTKLTVETALQGLNGDKVSKSALTYTENTVKGLKFRYQKKDNIVTVIVSGEATDTFSNQELMDTIPNAYKMSMNYHMLMLAQDVSSGNLKTIDVSGTEITCNTPIAVGDKPRGCITAPAL